MKNLKISYVYDNALIIILCLLLVLCTKSILVLILCSIYLIYRLNYKTILIFYLILLMVIIRLFINFIPLNHYYIKAISNTKIIASNLIYDVAIYQDLDVNLDTIIKLDDKKLNTNIDSLKNNIIYNVSNKTEIEIVKSIPTIRSFIYNKYNQLDEGNIKELIGKLLFNDINYDNENTIVNSLALSYLFLYKILISLFKKLKINDKYSYFIVSIAYILILGFNYSILRIIIIEILYYKCHKKVDALSISMLIMILYNPYSIHSYAFIIPFLIRLIFIFKSNINFKAILIIIQSYLFNEINPFLIIFYRIYMTLMSIAIIVALISLCINSYISINLIYKILEMISPLLNISFHGRLSIIVIISYYLIIKHLNIKNNKLQNIIIILLVLSNISNIFSSISFIDIGQGDAILIRSNLNRENILIDTGPEFSYYKLNRYLKKMGVYDIDYLIITHKDKDHSGNIKKLYKDFNIKETIVDHIDINTEYFNFISLNNNDIDNPNDSSLVYHLNHDGYNFLFTGDISKNIEENIINQNPYLDIDILKLSHHGSNTGTSQRLLNTGVRLAIASTSGMYNHPSKEVIELLKINQILLYITKDKGDIIITFSKLIDFIKCNDGEFVIIR